MECLFEGTDIAKHMSSSKIVAWKQNLYRKSLITEDGKVTTLGKELLTALSSSRSPKGVIKKVRKEADDVFEQWWKTYPATDMFTFSGRTFSGSRGLKQKKEECRKKFNDILLEGEYSADHLIEALKREIGLKMMQSVKDNENKMKYMQNTATYLNQRTFENFINPTGTVREILPVNTGAVDI